MKTLNQTETRNQNVFTSILKSVFTLMLLVVFSNSYGQDQEVEFDVYTNSAAKASRYLLADDVSMRDCASVHCEKLTTINIGTHVRLLAKSENAHVINGIKSRWYKVKLGPQTGWIWGGLISQKTMTSEINPEVKFVFGEAGANDGGKNCFQIRAIKNGVELDKIIVKSSALNHNVINLMNKKDNYNADVIRISNYQAQGFVTKADNYVIFKDNKFKQTKSLVAFQVVKKDKEGDVAMLLTNTQ